MPKIGQSGGFLVRILGLLLKAGSPLMKNVTRRTASDNILRDKAFNIAKIPRHDRYQKRLASMIYKFFDKKNSGGGAKD